MEGQGALSSSDEGAGTPVSAYMTHEEARAHHGVHLSAIYQAIGRGDLTTVKVLGKTVLTRQSVMEWQPRPNCRRKAPHPPGE